jgi:hypothetical protein
MNLDLSKKLCVFFALTNLSLFVFNNSLLNLTVGLAMLGWAAFIQYFLRGSHGQ